MRGFSGLTRLGVTLMDLPVTRRLKVAFGHWTNKIRSQEESSLISIDHRNEAVEIKDPISVDYSSSTSFMEAKTSSLISMKHPLSGKLGEIVSRLEREGFASLDDLMTLTGWQRHTVRAALCRLRKKGFVIVTKQCSGRKVYALQQDQ